MYAHGKQDQSAHPQFDQGLGPSSGRSLDNAEPSNKT